MVERERGGVTGDEPYAGSALLGAGHRLVAGLDAPHIPRYVAPQRGHVQREATDAAVEIPHRGWPDLVHPFRDLAIERRRRRGVGLEETLRPQVQVEVVDPHPERRSV